jgi:hypothetical protein
MSNFLKTRWQLLLIALLSLALAGVRVFFGILGRTADAPSSDGRARLLLTNTERDFVLNEMRHLLMATQAIVDAAVAGDMARVAAAARQVGMADVHNIPLEIRGPLIGKLPVEFKRLGFGVHEGMDAIALDAEGLGDRDHTLRQLAELMGKCVACHAAYTVLPPSQGERQP